MASERSLLQPGTLWDRVIARTESALQCGALRSIPTHYKFIEQAGIQFLVRTSANILRKEQARQEQTQASKETGSFVNPFLPYDPELYVADLSETHVCLLNKFNVSDHHLLIVTREFEAQEMLLTLPDFVALWACLAEIDGLGFYNGGKSAGASQPHKHLQVVPLPMVPEGLTLPIAPAIATANLSTAVSTIPAFPFKHAIVRLDPDCLTQPERAAAHLYSCYHTLLTALDLNSDREQPRQAGPYNFLVTRDWMLVVPRSREHFESISVNSLGFAGSLFVRDDDQMQQLQQSGPLTLLQQVAIAP